MPSDDLNYWKKRARDVEQEFDKVCDEAAALRKENKALRARLTMCMCGVMPSATDAGDDHA